MLHMSHASLIFLSKNGDFRLHLVFSNDFMFTRLKCNIYLSDPLLTICHSLKSQFSLREQNLMELFYAPTLKVAHIYYSNLLLL